MPEVGDTHTFEVLIADDDGAPLDPATVDVELIDPADAVTTPIVSNPAVGTYRTVSTLTAVGRWRVKWTTTGPAGVHSDFVDVDVIPPTLETLATIADIQDRIGGVLTPAQLAQAAGLLRSASAKVRAYTRQDFSYKADDAVVLRPTHSEIRLPQRPVISVASVAAVGLLSGGADVPLSGWVFDQIDIIRLDGLNSDVFVSLPAFLDDVGNDTPAYRVTYTHGYVTTPEVVVDVVIDMAVAVLESPSPVEGMVGENIGDYSYQMQQSSGTAGRTPRMTQAHRLMLTEAGFRRRATTIQVRS